MSVPTAPVPGAVPNAYLARPSYPVAAATKIWFGEMVCTDAAGNLVPATDTASLIYKGVAFESVDNSGGIAGALSCEVQPSTVDQGQFLKINAVSPDQTWVGKRVFVVDPTTCGLAGSTSHTVVIGTVDRIFASGTSGAVVVDTTQKSALATS